MNQPKKRFEKSRLLFSWLTPYALIRTVYKREISARRIDANTQIDFPENVVRSCYGTIAASIIVIVGALYFISSAVTSAAGTSHGPLTFIAVVAMVASVIKMKVSLDSLKELKRRMNGKPITPKQQINIGLDETTKSVALFRITVYRNMFFICGVYALVLSLSPRNIHEAYGLYSQTGTAPTMTFLSACIVLGLAAILFLRSFVAEIDRKKLLRAGATPSIAGYRTINNHYRILIAFSGLMLAIAGAGDILITFITEADASMWSIAGGRILLFFIIVYYSFIGFRSCASMCSMDSAPTPESSSLWSYLRLNLITLPEPADEEESVAVAELSYLTPSLCVLSVAALWLGSNVNWSSLLLVIAALMPIAMLLAVHHFYRDISHHISGGPNYGGV